MSRTDKTNPRWVRDMRGETVLRPRHYLHIVSARDCDLPERPRGPQRSAPDTSCEWVGVRAVTDGGDQAPLWPPSLWDQVDARRARRRTRYAAAREIREQLADPPEM